MSRECVCVFSENFPCLETKGEEPIYRKSNGPGIPLHWTVLKSNYYMVLTCGKMFCLLEQKRVFTAIILFCLLVP